jgi:hypothetical protein
MLVRCARCGNENPETNRFCGMCGGTLLQAPGQAASEPVAPTVATQTPAPSSSSSTIPAPAVAAAVSAPPAQAQPLPSQPPLGQTRPRTSDDAPVISGPSFLGLNEPAPSTRRRGSLSIDPNSAPSSRSLEYLLEDDEEPRRGGAGKYILIVMALALAVGFGYLRWKNQGFAWLNSSTKKPVASAQNSDAPDGSTPAPAASSTDTTTLPATGTPSQPSSAQPAASPPATASQPATDSTAAPATPAAAPASGSPVPAAAPAGAGDAGATSGTGSPAAAQPSTKDASDAVDNPSAATEPAKPAPVASVPKPRPAPKPVQARDPVSEAQKYLYGRGARQDCDHGLRILKPAADQANPKAMVEMGALYSAGLCTPHDLPTAYRWFAMALRKDPDNRAVQTDLQKLWGEMTQPERQLAIKLSQ